METGRRILATVGGGILAWWVGELMAWAWADEIARGIVQ